MNIYKITSTAMVAYLMDIPPVETITPPMVSESKAREWFNSQFIFQMIQSIKLHHRGVVPFDLTTGMCET